MKANIVDMVGEKKKKKSPFGKHHSASVPLLDNVLLDLFVYEINTLLFVLSAISQAFMVLPGKRMTNEYNFTGAGEEQIITEFILSSMLLLE